MSRLYRSRAVHLHGRHVRSPPPGAPARTSGGPGDDRRRKRGAGGTRRRDFVAAVQADIAAAGKKVAILVGESQAPGVHARALALHQSVGSLGTTLHMIDEPRGRDDRRPRRARRGHELGRGQDAPDARRQPGLRRPGGPRLRRRAREGDERPPLALPGRDLGGGRLAPAHGALARCWGDARSWDGTHHVAQPLLEPLHGGKSAIELCAMLLGREGDRRAEVRTFDALGLPESAERAASAVHDGVAEGTAYQPASVTASSSLPAIPAAAAGTECMPCPKVCRRPLRQQRLAPGAPGLHHEDDLRQRGADRRGDGQGHEGLHRGHGEDRLR